MQRSSALQGRLCYCNTLLTTVSAGQQSLYLAPENTCIACNIEERVSGELHQGRLRCTSERYGGTSLHTVVTISQLAMQKQPCWRDFIPLNRLLA